MNAAAFAGELAAIAGTLGQMPATPANRPEWVALALVVGFLAKMLYDVLLRLVAPPKPPDTGKGTADVLGALDRHGEALRVQGEALRDVQDRVRRLDDLHAVRSGTGDPVWYCSARQLDAERLHRLEDTAARLLEGQKQGNGLLARLTRRLRG